MLAETAHLAAGTLNQAFLLTSLRRSDRPADARHPFGYFWSLLLPLAPYVFVDPTQPPTARSPADRR